MAEQASETIYLKDYQEPSFWVDHVYLEFSLAPSSTRVKSKIKFRPNPQNPSNDLWLDGQFLTLISAQIDGQDVAPTVSSNGLRVPAPDQPFVWTAEVEIAPDANTALEGLYMSNGMYCTQCEAEGFRRITYYPDRPDVMAPFDVKIVSDAPVLLSNGNPKDRGDGWAEWSDPWPKPAYLFALVAGDLIAHPGQFKTMSGRDVVLNIYVRDGDQDKCDFAMDALKASMKWDEDVYNREYDLDIFNIVAVDDFNMGAMENKGLNIFNSAAVLANPATSTDANFERIEAIIAHEYFHNWTGNRITCRDWFQLCLKEGLTVFRDQQFSADLRDKSVRRIDDVLALRGRQFREDNGPLSHPVRPESFVEINNFYTATVYEKGAEIIGMLKTLVGDAAYTKALDLYFERHDGQACTIEDWLQVFEDVTGRDLSQFKLWYAQAGTPKISVSDAITDQGYEITLTQDIPDTPGQKGKKPMLMPIALGLLDDTGHEILLTQILELNQAEQTFRFDGITQKPVPSFLRHFSAPVILDRDTSEHDQLILLANDTDAFNRWEAGRQLGKTTLLDMIQKDAEPSSQFLGALSDVVSDTSLSPALRAQFLNLASEDEIAQTIYDDGTTPDPIKIHKKRSALLLALAETLGDDLGRLYEANLVTGPYSPNATDCGKRALGNAILGLLSKLDGGAAAKNQFENADNQTLQFFALGQMVNQGIGEQAVEAYYRQWSHERLVLDKWFTLQVAYAPQENALTVAENLSKHPDFSLKNPNRFRALMGAFAGTPAAFHDPSGRGYELVANHLVDLDQLNPQLTARMCTVFETWKRYDEARQTKMRGALQKVAQSKDLSRDTTEMVTRLLG